MKKALLLLALLASVLLAGCGNDDWLRAPSVNEISREESVPAAESEETVSGITLPDDIWG